MFIKKIIFIILIFLSNLYAHDKHKVTLQLDWMNQFQFAGYYIAKEKGFYKEKNLDVTIKEFKKDINFVDNVLENENTYSIGNSSLIIDKLNNKDIVFLAAIFQTSPIILISLKESNINKINDLKNKKVMITPQSMDSINIKSMLKSQNINFDNIDFIPDSFNLDDLINGKVDALGAFLSSEPYTLKNKKVEFNIFNPSDFGFGFYGGILFTSNNELENNPKKVSDFYEASIKGWNYAFSNIEETAQLIFEKYNTQNKTLAALIYEANILKKLSQPDSSVCLGCIDPNKITEIKRLYLILGLGNNSNTKLDNLIFDHEKAILNKLENKFIKDNSFSLISNINNTPFSFLKDNEIKGIETDLFKLISKKMNISYNIIEKPKNLSIFKNIKTNDIHFEYIYSKNNINLKETLYSNPILTIPMALATNSDKNLITDLSILKGQKLAILRDSDIYKELISKYKNIYFILVDTKEEGFELLKDKKVFGFIDNILSLSHTIIKEKMNNIKISGTLPYDFEMRIATKKENFVFLDIVNKIIPTLKKEDKEAILKQYQLIFIKQVNDYSWVYKYLTPLLFMLLVISFLNNKMRKEINKRKEAEEALKDYASKDSLTGIYNRGKIDELLKSQIKISKRYGETFSIIFFDIDNFKLINDDFGHIVGDDILKEISSLVSNNIRETDVIGRWGGEEFIIILPRITSNKAFILADNIRELVSVNNFSINRTITISLGITQYTKEDTKEDLIQRADEAMYFVKGKGRNGVKIL